MRTQPDHGKRVPSAMPRTSAPPRKYISIAKAAAYCDVTTRTIYRWIASGDLPACRFGPALLRVDQGDLDKLARPVPAAPGR